MSIKLITFFIHISLIVYEIFHGIKIKILDFRNYSVYNKIKQFYIRSGADESAARFYGKNEKRSWK